MKTIDPFCSELPIWHPKRSLMKFYVALCERSARSKFKAAELPQRTVNAVKPVPFEEGADETAVTPLQLGYLLHAVSLTESMPDTAIVELGSYRGVTTRALARSTARKVVAVDRYLPRWAEAESALADFRRRTANLPNVTLCRQSSGQAAAQWNLGPISMLFVDAQHNYVNTRFDVNVWQRHLIDGALVAMHDVDRKHFAGTRLAAYELMTRYELVAHVDNLALFRHPKHP